MSAEENKAKVRAFWEEGMNKGNLGAVDALLAPTELSHNANAPATQNTPASIRKFLGEMRAAFPDAHVTVEDLIAEGDKVVNRVTMRGTHTGVLHDEFLGDILPTGKVITFSGIAINRFVDGRSVEVWTQFDDLGFLQQLGVIPPLEQKAS